MYKRQVAGRSARLLQKVIYGVKGATNYAINILNSSVVVLHSCEREAQGSIPCAHQKINLRERPRGLRGLGGPCPPSRSRILDDSGCPDCPGLLPARGFSRIRAILAVLALLPLEDSRGFGPLSPKTTEDHEYYSPRTVQDQDHCRPGPLRITSKIRPGPLQTRTAVAQDH